MLASAAMVENEIDAYALAAMLGKAGIDARVAGKDTWWRIEMGSTSGRALLVHCLRYETATSVGSPLSGHPLRLGIGLNPTNARSRLNQTQRPYEGPEYRVMLEENDRQIVDGTTRSADAVVACAKAWLSHRTLDQLMRDLPFIDEGPRTMRAIAERLAAFRLDGAEDPGFELWVYGHGRSCKIRNDRAIACGFFLGQAQVAYGVELRDVVGAIEAWLVEATTLRGLTTRFPDVELERHAEVLESDPARWHWLHVRCRIADPNDVLAPMRKLIEALAVNPVATTFFTYSSVTTFCFSASSHHPWVDAGLPVVSRVGSDSYQLDNLDRDTRYPACDARRAVQVIETVLEASPIRPFFGSRPHHEHPFLSERFERQGSALRPELVQRQTWYDLVVADQDTGRRCKVSDRHVTFMERADQLDLLWPSVDDAVDAIRRFCEGKVPLDVLANDPRAQSPFSK